MSKNAWRYSFALADLATAVRVSEAVVREAKRRREFDPRDFTSVVRWATMCLLQQAMER